jgi:hypothetical protein
MNPVSLATSGEGLVVPDHIRRYKVMSAMKLDKMALEALGQIW